MRTSESNEVRLKKGASGISIIALNRTHCKNAVNTATAQKLYDAFIEFESDETQKVCVFYGENDTFCAGYDLKELASGNTQKLHAEPVVKNVRSKGPMGPSRLQIIKPVIAAISGYAIAGGLELSLLADLRVVEEDAVFGVFCRRWGVPLIDGGTVRLQAIIGLGRAMDMIMTGRAVSAREAYEIGLANRIVPRGQSLEEALRIAENLLQFPQMCLRVDRENCYYSAYNATSFEDALAREFDRGSKIITLESISGAGRFSSGAGRHGQFKL